MYDIVLEKVNETLNTLATQHDLQKKWIERWHNDVPEITLSWVHREIWRSISVLVIGYPSSIEKAIVRVTVNAWVDEQDEKGIWTRNWQHELIGEDSVLKEQRIFTAFDIISEWDYTSLTNKKVLPEETNIFLEKQTTNT